MIREPTGPVVGFDLDMTLVDPRPGAVAAYAALARETGVAIDGELAASRIGPPLEQEIAHWFPAPDVDAMADAYRRHFAGIGVAGTEELPGARQALEAVRAHRGRAVVVTSKSDYLARATLDRLDLSDLVHDVVGRRWAEAKGDALREQGARIYVGDHLGDIRAARAAGALAVSVATGPIGAAKLSAAGADVVLTDLTEFPEWLSGHLLDEKRQALIARLQECGSVLVAFSGGADSALLLAAAVRALGAGSVVAATAVSPSLPAGELVAAQRFCADLGVRHLTPSTNELERAGYRANAGDRCAFCKTELVETLLPLATANGLRHVATGTNADDLVAGFRPGIGAAARLGAVTPLADAGLTKDEVRRLSRTWDLPTWDKPAAACLASRIAYGVEVSRERLERVETAERQVREALQAAGIAVRNLRVRDLGETARVEVDRDAVATVAARPDLLAAVTGWPRVELDRRGFRSGSMNELLPAPAQPGDSGDRTDPAGAPARV